MNTSLPQTHTNRHIEEMCAIFVQVSIHSYQPILPKMSCIQVPHCAIVVGVYYPEQ